MEAPAFLPLPIRWVLNWLFFSLLRDGDDFTQTLRKIASSVLLLAAPVPLSFAVWSAYRAATGAPKYGAMINPLFTFPMGLFFIFNYVYLRRTRHMTDAHAGGLIIFISLDWFCIYLCIPEYDPRVTTGSVAILSVLARPPRAVHHIVLGFLLAVATLSLYNQAYRFSGHPLLLVPGPYRPGTPVEDFMALVTSMFCLVLGIAGVVAQAGAHVGALKAAEAGIQMSNDVVALLRTYDTDAVEEVLETYAKAGDASANLVEAFRAINGNLQRYRPHLPNYVLMKAEPEEDESEGESAGTDTKSEPRDKTPNTTLSAHMDGTDSCSSNRSADPHAASSRLSNSNLNFALTNSRFRGRISMAMVDLYCLSSAAHDTSGVFDHLYDFATQFHASVHSTIGDVVLLSWNATRRLAQPELKAAKFLLRLLRAVGGVVGTARPIGGAVFTGVASCSTVASQGGRQQSLLLSAPWLEALDAAFRLAQSTRSAIIDGDTNVTASYEVESRAVDRLQYVPRDQPGYAIGERNVCFLFGTSSPPEVFLTSTVKSTVLYELVGELNRQDDEWMYQLAHATAAQSESSKVTRAFDLATAGQFGDALALLAEAAASNLPLPSRMRTYCERGVLQRSQGVSASVTHRERREDPLPG